MSRIAYQGYVYEKVLTESLDENTLRDVYDEMHVSLKHLSNVLGKVQDGNMKKAVRGLMKRTEDVFNDTIKDANYHPKSEEELKQISDNVDNDMQVKQGLKPPEQSELPNSENSI